MIDWLTNALICVGMLCMAIVLMLFGFQAEQGAWERDCAALGKHRSGDKVYVCKLESRP